MLWQRLAGSHMKAFKGKKGIYFSNVDSFSNRACVLMEMHDTFLNSLPHFSSCNEKQKRSLKNPQWKQQEKLRERGRKRASRSRSREIFIGWQQGGMELYGGFSFRILCCFTLKISFSVNKMWPEQINKLYTTYLLHTVYHISFVATNFVLPMIQDELPLHC